MNQTGPFGHAEHSAPMHTPREASGQHLNTAGYGYNQYQNMSPATNSGSVPSTPGSASHSINYNGDGDVPMEDADPYNRSKYPSRPTQHARSSSHYLAHEGSAAAQRYSPMAMLNAGAAFPTSPKAQTQGQSLYAYQTQTPRSRQSPTRQNHFSPSQQYQESPGKRSNTLLILFFEQASLIDFAPASARYNSDFPAQTLNSEHGPDGYYAQSPIDQQGGSWTSKSQMSLRPQNNVPPQTPGGGPVPRFQKVKSVQELKPRINSQPPFRRANPEGGFISVCLEITQYCVTS